MMVTGETIVVTGGSSGLSPIPAPATAIRGLEEVRLF